MMHRIQTLIFYTAALVLLLVVYHFATSFGFAVVDEGYRYMEPTVGQRETLLLDKRRSTVVSLERGDLIAYTSVYRDRTMRMFARVAALPGMTISVRDQRLLVEGDDVAPAPRELNLLQTGLMVPRDSVFVIFDSPLGKRIPVPQRLVPYRNILGRAVGE
jgi:hypothetical protein